MDLMLVRRGSYYVDEIDTGGGVEASNINPNQMCYNTSDTVKI